MNVVQIITLVGAIGGPLSGIVVAWITIYRSKREKRESLQVTDKSLDIQEQEADTHYWSEIVRGFQEQVQVVTDLYAASERKVNSLETRYDKLEKRFEDGEKTKQEMLAHIISLEGLVPNPPGPPRRPWL